MSDCSVVKPTNALQSSTVNFPSGGISPFRKKIDSQTHMSCTRNASVAHLMCSHVHSGTVHEQVDVAQLNNISSNTRRHNNIIQTRKQKQALCLQHRCSVAKPERRPQCCKACTLVHKDEPDEAVLKRKSSKPSQANPSQTKPSQAKRSKANQVS